MMFLYSHCVFFGIYCTNKNITIAKFNKSKDSNIKLVKFKIVTNLFKVIKTFYLFLYNIHLYLEN